MVNVSNKEFFAVILSSNILSPYLQQDSSLAELMKTPSHPDIHYPRSYASARQIASIFKRRLKHMISKHIYLNLDATQKLVAFIEEHPESQIYDVTFNCVNRHYGVRIGLIENRLQVICLMTGGYIPDEAF